MTQTLGDVGSIRLLATKYRIPHARSGVVSRPHLIERLRRGVPAKVTLVSAPAGFGKTTLLTQWIAKTPYPVAWVSLDAGDDDVARFWTYVIAALQTLEASLGPRPLRCFAGRALFACRSSRYSPVSSTLSMPPRLSRRSF